MELSNDTLKNWANQVKNELGLKTFDLHLSKQGTTDDSDIKLDMISVPYGNKKQGLGTAAMNKLINFADIHQKRITLSPAQKDPNFGTTSQSRLIDFYKRFGFVRNSGRNKDFRISDMMLREPKKKLTEKSFKKFFEVYKITKNK